MNNRRPFDPTNPDHQHVVEAMPMARAVARARCSAFRVRDPETIADAEQRAYLALHQGLRHYDPSRGPYAIYAYKGVYGAVTKHLVRERAARQEGVDAALDAAASLRDRSSPYDEDEEALDQLKGHLRYVAFRRFLGDARAALAKDPENALMRARVYEALEKALGRLNTMEERFIELRYWEELSFAKVAEELGVHEKYAQRLDEALCARLNRDLRVQNVCEAPPPVTAHAP